MHNTPNTTRSRSGKVLAGTILIAVGTILLLHELDLFFFPRWLFSWPMILIVIGLIIGARHQFRNPAWFILVTIGAVFLVERFYPMMNAFEYLWPLLIIFFGLYMIFGRHQHRRGHWPPPAGPAAGTSPYRPNQPAGFTGNPTAPGTDAPVTDAQAAPPTDSDYLNSTSVFGGVKKNIISKNFQGGEIITFLGGAEINLSQADIQGRAVLDVTQVMGGTRIIVPPHWDVVSEMAAIFGGIEDKRFLQPGAVNPNKVLIIKGTSVMGGIDIRSY
jgi:predicted membrane protein